MAVAAFGGFGGAHALRWLGLPHPPCTLCAGRAETRSWGVVLAESARAIWELMVKSEVRRSMKVKREGLQMSSRGIGAIRHRASLFPAGFNGPGKGRAGR